jgi:ATP/maltotriose-dependent transcriptional regulator MalT
VDDRSSAGPLYDALLPVAHQHAVIAHGIATRGPIARHLGMLAVCLGEFSRAEAHLEQALAMAERMRSPPMTADVYCEMARLYLKRGRAGDPALASELLQRAAALGAEFGLNALGAKCRRMAREFSLSPRV